MIRRNKLINLPYVIDNSIIENIKPAVIAK